MGRVNQGTAYSDPVKTCTCYNLRNRGEEHELYRFLLAAQKKFGNVITVHGGKAFKVCLVRIAIKNSLDVVFTDNSMERLKQEIQLKKSKSLHC